MDMKGEQLIPLQQDKTWDALNDIDVLKGTIPGCEKIERVSDFEFDVVMQAKIGPVSARFKGRMTLKDVNPPQGYTLSFDGQGGAAGFAKGEARVELLPDGAQTLLRYTAKANIGGKLAQIGSRLVDGAARKLADQFFTAFREQMSGNTGAE
ncbi:MAG TPA: carbon monoxide dehydrogenase subunit G [Burkholderiales bacterium]|nr:carbon monoxide dehydrogenase subunit G [Burkholderiales bacterium]